MDDKQTDQLLSQTAEPAGMMCLRTTSFSTNLERIGVTDIGRRSEKVLTAAVLGMGVTSAVFHEEGGMPVCTLKH